MNYEIRTIELAEQPTIVVKRRAKVSEVGAILARDLPRIFHFVSQSGGQIAGAPFTRDLSFKDGVFEFEAGLPLVQAISGTDEFYSSKLDGGKFATTSHYGSYEQLPEAHKALVMWLKANNHSVQFPMWDQYVSDPTATALEKIETRIFYPINV